MARWLLVSFLWLVSSAGSAQGKPVNALPSNVGFQTLSGSTPAHAWRFARVASITGVVSASLVLSSALAISLGDAQPHTERVARSVHLGFTVLASPFVALGGWTARRRADVVGHPRLRTWGWTFYTAAVSVAVLDLYDALHDEPVPASRTIIQGSFAALSLLMLSFDAYQCARHARTRSLRLGLSPLGVYAQF